MAPDIAPSPLVRELNELEAIVDELCARLGADHGKALQGLSQCLSQAYTLLFPKFRHLAQEGAEDVRHALVRAVAEAADPKDPFRASFLLEILSPLLCDPLPAIRRKARRVLRERLLGAYPEETVDALVQWAADPEQGRRLLAAQMLGHVPPKFARRALIALKHLARCGDGKARRAALSALKRLLQNSPALVKSELTSWGDDPALAPLVARLLAGQ